MDGQILFEYGVRVDEEIFESGEKKLRTKNIWIRVERV